ncbi:MAG: hypothetical protein MUC68_03520 [Burkholderiaceae bacterium]|nr:hypothetical protein [Burkholderiaceae bacterium]
MLDAKALTDAEAHALLARSHALVTARLTRAQQRELGLNAAVPSTLATTAAAPPRPRRPRPSPI